MAVFWTFLVFFRRFSRFLPILWPIFGKARNEPLSLW
jgi:hypothetical protein